MSRGAAGSTEATATTDPVVARVAALVAPIAAELDADVLDVEVVTGRAPFVRLVVDAAIGPDGVVPTTGLDVDRIAELSRRAGEALDALELGDGPWTLEVSSPGTDRPLATARDFARNVGRRVRVERTDGSVVEGDVIAVDAAGVRLETGTGTSTVALDAIVRGLVVLPW